MNFVPQIIDLQTAFIIRTGMEPTTLSLGRKQQKRLSAELEDMGWAKARCRCLGWKGELSGMDVMYVDSDDKLELSISPKPDANKIDLKDISDLARKIDRLEKNFAKADYILSEVMSALVLDPTAVNAEGFEWAMRNYQEYLKDKGRR